MFGHSTMRWVLGGVLAFFVWLVVTGAAMAACTGATVLFQDNFDQLQPTWGEPNDTMKLESGQLVVTPAADQYFWQQNTANLYDDIDLCVNMTTVTGVDPEEAKAGLLFWYVDVNNFYVFELAPNGKASVWRRQRGRWLIQVAWQEAKGANAGDGAINELRVTTVGNQATFYVNGAQFKALAGSPPDNGQQVGIFVVSPAKGAATFAFANFKVTKP
jgi:hypothetical protein